jgi:hypothetical protein
VVRLIRPEEGLRVLLAVVRAVLEHSRTARRLRPRLVIAGRIAEHLAQHPLRHPSLTNRCQQRRAQFAGYLCCRPWDLSYSQPGIRPPQSGVGEAGLIQRAPAGERS